MKKIFALALLSGLASAAQAQTVIKAGTVQLGGNVGYSRNSQDSPNINSGYNPSTLTTTASQFAIAPAAGYFVADNLAIGISGTYRITHIVNNAVPSAFSSDRKVTEFRVGAFAQYYKMVSEQFGFTGTLGGGYQYSGDPYGYYTGDSAGKGFYANLTPTIVFFPIPKLAIGASIGGINYSYLSYKTPGNYTNQDSYASSSFGADFGLSQLLLSGTYYFGR